jgi:hypothetical protein
MKFSRRLVIFVYVLLIILLVGMFYWPFILNEVIAPISLGVWVLLRIFVLSIDQKYYWVAIIFIASFLLYRCLLPRVPLSTPSNNFHFPNETMSSIGSWRGLFAVIDRKIQHDQTLKKELAYLLLTLYATNQHVTADFRLYDALRNGQISLPEDIHTFLFAEEPQQTGRSVIRLIHSIQKTLRKWVDRWTGQEMAEHYRMIDEVLSFMETSLEIKNDERKLTPNNH